MYSHVLCQAYIRELNPIQWKGKNALVAFLRLHWQRTALQRYNKVNGREVTAYCGDQHACGI